MQLNAWLVKMGKNYKIIDVLTNVMKNFILMEKLVRIVVELLKNVRNAPSNIVMNVKKIIFSKKKMFRSLSKEFYKN